MALLRDNKINPVSFSSFMTVEKTLAQVVQMLMTNKRLKKMLYYSDKHALSLPDLNEEQTFSLLDNQIKIVPKLVVDPDVKPYVIISLDSFVPMNGSTTFRNVTLSFDVLCAYTDWKLDNFKLRPYSIAGEIDGMINQSTLKNGIADFMGAKQLVLNEHLGGVSLYYNLETILDDMEKQTSQNLDQIYGASGKK